MAYDLARRMRPGELEVVLVSESYSHFEVPLFYEVATAYLDRESTQSSERISSSSGVALSDLFEGLTVRLYHAKVKSLATRERMVYLEDGTTCSFDWLVLTPGAQLATYDIPGVREHAFNVKTLPEALRLRHHIVRHLRSYATPGVARATGALIFSVVGGGASGVETAAELTHLIRRVCRKHKLDEAAPQVILFEAGSELLREASREARAVVAKALQGGGVQVRLKHAVAAVESTRLVLADGSGVPTHTVIWAGGLAPLPWLLSAGLPMKRWGVEVGPTLSVKGEPYIFMAGDAAMLPEPAPATVLAAYTQGAVVARNILHAVRGEALETYQYQAMPQIITLGGKRALLLWGTRRSFMGLTAWFLKRIVSFRYWWHYLPWYKALAVWYRALAAHTKND